MPIDLRAVSAKILDVNVAEIIDYETPEQTEEWHWIEANASYAHRRNGHLGVWEFIINTANEFPDIPASLEPFFELAEKHDVAYILFHQGT